MPSISLSMNTPVFFQPRPISKQLKIASNKLENLFQTLTLKNSFSKILSDAKDEIQVENAEKSLQNLVQIIQLFWIRSVFSSIRAEALIQVKAESEKVEYVRQDFGEFVQKMRGSILEKVLEAKDKSKNMEVMRKVVKEWRVFVFEKERVMRRKCKEIQERRRVRAFRKFLEALKLKEKGAEEVGFEDESYG